MQTLMVAYAPMRLTQHIIEDRAWHARVINYRAHPIRTLLLLSQKRKPRRVLSRIVSLQICRETGGFRYAIPTANAPPACRPDGGGLARSARRGKLRAGKQR